MGNSFSSAIYSFLQYLGLYSKEATIAVIGLDNAGKTTILYQLLHNKLIQMAPSLHVNEESFTYGGISIKAYDIGGQESFRVLWKRFLVEVDAVLYLVDSADSERFEEVKTELGYLKDMETMKNRPLGLLLNKSDLPNKYSQEKICQLIGANDILKSNENAAVFQTSALKRDSILSVFNWLVSMLN